MKVTFYKFSKRENSTKRVTSGAPSQEYDVILKDASSVMTPNIELNIGNLTCPSEYNYAYIPDFKRFYFVSNWTYYRGIWRADMTVDVLATWKTEIGNSTEYIIRCSAESDGNIVDEFYPTKADMTYQIATRNDEYDWTFTTNIGQGMYVLGVINTDRATVGAVSYYVLNNKAMRAFSASLLSDTPYPGTIQKEDFNPFQYIISCQWFPFSSLPVSTPTPVNPLPAGWWDIPYALDPQDTPAYPLSDYARKIQRFSISLPSHPQISRGGYLKLAPYTRYILDARPWGYLPIDSSLLIGVDTLYGQMIIDCISGEGILSLYRDDSFQNEIATYKAQVGVQIQLAQVITDRMKLAGTSMDVTMGVLTSSAINAAAGNTRKRGGRGYADLFGSVNLFGGSYLYNTLQDFGQGVENQLGDNSTVKEYVSAIGQAASARASALSTAGGNGSFADYTSDYLPTPVIYAQFTKIADEDNEHCGRPLCKKRVIRNIPGFIKVADPDITAPATSIEEDSIKSYMAAGFYYE